MQHGNHRHNSSFWSSLKDYVTQHQPQVVVALMVVAIIIIWIAMPGKHSASRTESYKKVSGDAGLVAHINYDCKSSCKDKYGFNVYVFNSDGQQVSVVRPDKDGVVRLATASGSYVLLIGKSIGVNGLFPQEKVELKNGQELDLKLHYKEGVL